MHTRRIQRLLKLIQSLERHRSQSVEELADAVGVSRRTLFRDLDLLAQAGLRYTYDRESKRYTAERSTLLPPVTLSQAEALALLLAVDAVAQRGDIVDRDTAATLALKLESLFPPALRESVSALSRHIEVRPAPTSDPSSIREILALLQRALLHKRKVRARYDSYFEGRTLDVVLQPYRLVYIHRGWYLIAFTQGVSAVRTYKVERLVHVHVLPDPYEIDPKFNLDDYFGNAWMMIRGDRRYHVKIRFSPQVAGNVDEVMWHKTQRTTFESDGSLLFEVDVDGITEISWWILGYGDQAEVLEPPELRALIATRVRMMHEMYQNRSSSPEGTEPRASDA
ncbi:MAG: WYL domain-containing protein [Planctomycetota bacterium]|nr:MAG: WYL domain-containing protein [Planctomycetota bacterium]